MRWKPTGRSDRDDNVEDRRGQGGGGFGRRSGGLGGGLPMGKGKGIGGVIILIIAAIFGGGQLLSGGGGDGGGFGGVGNAVENTFPEAPAAADTGDLSGAPDPNAELKKFVKYVFVDSQETFRGILGSKYRNARLVTFSDATQTGCGQASAETGPFYCPPDQTVYIDFGFYRELQNKFGAPGDFAQAYVIAHEMGHHVQTLLGINEQVRQRSQAEPRDANPLSVRLELQADCLAGVWAQSQFARGNLEEGDIEEGLGAAAAVGDDRIQKQATGRISPENFTHGTSEQRAKWFNEGFAAGNINACNTFNQDI